MSVVEINGLNEPKETTVVDGNYRPIQKHTPGPWYATPDTDRDTWWVSQQPEGGTFWIAEAVNGLMNDETEPNARLIAAAPDLLNALETLNKYIDFTVPCGDGDFNVTDASGLNAAFQLASTAIAKAYSE